MTLLPKSLVGRTALFVTLILMANQFLWFGVVRPVVFNPYVQAEQVHHPEGILRLYLELEWGALALLTSTVGVYVIFYWLRRQLHSVVSAAKVLESGQTPPPLPETGPDEIRELSRGFNRLATNLETLEADRRLMLVGISHDLATPLTRLRLGLELLQIKGDITQVAGMVHDVEDMNAILTQFKDYARDGKEEQPAAAFPSRTGKLCGPVSPGNCKVLCPCQGRLPSTTRRMGRSPVRERAHSLLQLGSRLSIRRRPISARKSKSARIRPSVPTCSSSDAVESVAAY